MSLVFVTDDIIKKLNRRFLGRSYATDVLAFDLGEPTVTKKLRRSRTKRISLTGEIVISITTAFRQAKIYKTSPYEEVILYIVHGILHLLGYDDHASRDTRLMRKKEQELLAVIRPLLKKARR
ncbi:MAG: rRNA maturation RNase YbeY [Omnitrophica WOR_2 bacterium RIFCSPHIGHO2_01_FULL_48_9]|nr:MAG: rRNA maturation RNase YbeY [Omnitrophica WOR_2 bacterium RIFCSPHIGHO2_02_FULL_48_11]OGX34377.1 MAG: rRNA maturation RNase YbeY [Omnitrophica WOR_2 bacterium RIFCSPHIGHO2_01_FULL_48_9]